MPCECHQILTTGFLASLSQSTSILEAYQLFGFQLQYVITICIETPTCLFLRMGLLLFSQICQVSPKPMVRVREEAFYGTSPIFLCLQDHPQSISFPKSTSHGRSKTLASGYGLKVRQGLEFLVDVFSVSYQFVQMKVLLQGQSHGTHDLVVMST